MRVFYTSAVGIRRPGTNVNRLADMGITTRTDNNLGSERIEHDYFYTTKQTFILYTQKKTYTRV